MDFERKYQALLDENKHLKIQLNQYRQILQQNNSLPIETTRNSNFNEINTTKTKHEVINKRLTIYQNLFRGRDDVFALRWVRGDKAGYSPAKNSQGHLLPLTKDVLFDHLSGKLTIGLYPILPDNSCFLLAFDFDKKHWKDDVAAFIQVLKNYQLNSLVEISQSGEGCHIWLFFSERIPASCARQLGNKLLREAAYLRQKSTLPSYDRMFPTQDVVNENGLGNLIALPLQGEKRKAGKTVFVDRHFQVVEDQWKHLEQITCYSQHQIQNILEQQSPNNQMEVIQESAEVVQREGLHIPKYCLTPTLIEKLTTLCTVSNPEYFKAKSQRLPTDRIPSRIKAYLESPTTFVFPRGKADEILNEIDMQVSVRDLREYGNPLEVEFLASLFPQQQEALDHLKKVNCGVLSATTGFGKTVVAAALIAERKVSTLILVHRNQLIDQWKTALTSFLSIESKEIGQIGGGKNKPTGQIDIATIQSIRTRGLEYPYGQIIVDECHHISAYSFEEILKRQRSAYVHGLTATPVRKDKLHPLMFMQCGPVVFKIDAKQQATIRQFHHILHPIKTDFKSQGEGNDILDQLIHDNARNEIIFNDILKALDQKRNPLVLTERVEHLHILVTKLKSFTKNIIILTGALSKKELKQQFEKLAQLPDHEERIILATGKYAGEGFDNPRLDTIFLTMPVSWKGTLAQYVGRLHRAFEGKESVEVYDYVDHREEAFLKMYEKRLKGYNSLGYSTVEEAKKEKSQMRLF
ncbi:DEAD/DEAH box helicase family protein [Chryseomicrobium sp. FSL W7-1435]|uniref:TOTE conflict system archaeo-eukaryotic primase domain-containing protein n=1 Tax=Chryseomicrobium sp. FSL W7-1435 TaxID=2921704 RepID=UPI00315A064C